MDAREEDGLCWEARAERRRRGSAAARISIGRQRERTDDTEERTARSQAAVALNGSGRGADGAPQADVEDDPPRRLGDLGQDEVARDLQDDAWRAGQRARERERETARSSEAGGTVVERAAASVARALAPTRPLALGAPAHLKNDVALRVAKEEGF